MSEQVRVVDHDSIEMYRARVKFLSAELLETTEQLHRMNVSLMLAEAASTLARMECEQWQLLQEKQFSSK